MQPFLAEWQAFQTEILGPTSLSTDLEVGVGRKLQCQGSYEILPFARGFPGKWIYRSSFQRERTGSKDIRVLNNKSWWWWWCWRRWAVHSQVGLNHCWLLHWWRLGQGTEQSWACKTEGSQFLYLRKIRERHNWFNRLVYELLGITEKRVPPDLGDWRGFSRNDIVTILIFKD